jgi:hypothetical protein
VGHQRMQYLLKDKVMGVRGDNGPELRNSPSLAGEQLSKPCGLRVQPDAQYLSYRQRDSNLEGTGSKHRWYGEAEGLKVSLAGANAKLAQMDQISASRTKTVQLGIPSFTDTAARTTDTAARTADHPKHQNQF